MVGKLDKDAMIDRYFWSKILGVFALVLFCNWIVLRYVDNEAILLVLYSLIITVACIGYIQYGAKGVR